ncbi:MAG: peptidylprolyl isomerase [Melioribacteraceae bacterium]|nr:peptidylprolyl isomerase [Melioribacteraceae bacterium]
MIFKKLLHIIFILALSISTYAQSKTVVSKVGDYNITKNELITRFEMTPQIGLRLLEKNKEKLNNLLYTLIAEKLWAYEAKSIGLDTTEAIRSAFRIIEKLHAKDALWKQEIKSKVLISDEDYQKAFDRSRTELSLSFLHSESHDEIIKLHSDLNSGANFDSLLSLMPSNIKETQPFKIIFNQMEESIEDILFALNVNEYTEPVKSPMGWFIFKLVSKTNIEIKNEKQFDALNKEVKDIVEQRATDKIYSSFYEMFFKDKKIRTNGFLFNSFATAVITELQNNQKENQLKPEDQNDLTKENMYSIESKLGNDSLAMNFIELDDSPVSLRQFLDEFHFDGFYTKTLDKKTLFAKLNARVKSFIEGELIAREAIKRGLHNLPEVKEELEMWKSNYLSNALKQKFVREIFYSKEETKKHYDEIDSEIVLPKMVNIIEILTGELENVSVILAEIEKGTSFSELAKKYNERKSTRLSNGEYGFFSITEHGEIGSIAAEMNVGDVYGPLQIDEGWSIFKLIDKKEQVKTSSESYENIKDELRKKLSLDKYNKTIVERTIKMADKYGVSIDENILSRIEPINMNMVVYRYYGFGGRTLAVPLNVPFTSWFKPWKEGVKYLP